MKYSVTTALFLAAVALASCALAADTATLEKFDEALKAVTAFEQGDGNRGALMEIERIVFRLPAGDPSRGAIEQKLVDILASTTTADGKRFLCTQLRVIGTARCVPALEKLLTDREVSHAAVYALGRMDAAEATRALVRALGKTSGDLQAGIINALADRGACQGIDYFEFLESADPTVAKAAARALGRVVPGCLSKTKPLIEARAKASGPLALEIDNALLQSAEQLAAVGSKDQAAAIYQTFYKSDRPIQLRAAGLRGLILTQGEKAVPVLRNAIVGEDTELQRTAISYVTLAAGEKATLAFAGAVDALQPEGRALLLRALGNRGDMAASGVIWRETKNPDQAVRMAALEALAKLGDALVVDPLTRAAAAAEGEEQKVARASLVRLEGDGVDRKLIAATGTADAAVCVEAVHALAGRGATEAVKVLLELAGSDEAAIRNEALWALGALGRASDLPPIIQLAVKPKQADDRPAIEAALGRAILRIDDQGSRARPVLAALKSAPADVKPILVRLLSKSGSPEALAAVRRAIGSSEPAVAEAAVQALANWPDASVTEDLLKLLATSHNEEHKSTALEGFVRLAAKADDPTAMYLRVLDLVQRSNDKKLVLAGLGQSESSDSAEVLDLAQKFLADRELGPTAGLATLRIANRMKDRDRRRARTALDNVIATVDHEDVRQRAQEVINDMEKYDDHIVQWVGVGPYTEKGKDGAGVYATVFEPETADAEEFDWKPLTKGVGAWNIDMEATFGGLDHVAAFVRTRVWSEIEQDAQLEMGADDAIRAWLNGQMVYDEYSGGGVTPRQKRVKIKLAKGWNQLMLKVVDHEGGWGFCCRIRKPDGTALKGLKIQAP